MAENDAVQHILIPGHRKLSEKEKEALFTQYRITGRDLPLINKNDAAIQHLDAEAGDVIEVKRKSLTAGHALFYRIVVNK